MFVESLLLARYCSECLAYILPFNPQTNPNKWILLLAPPLCRWRNGDMKKWKNTEQGGQHSNVTVQLQSHGHTGLYCVKSKKAPNDLAALATQLLDLPPMLPKLYILNGKTPLPYFPLCWPVRTSAFVSFSSFPRLTTTKAAAELPSIVNCGKYQVIQNPKSYWISHCLLHPLTNISLRILNYSITHPIPAKQNQLPWDLSYSESPQF